MSKGYVYILENEHLSYVKIGKTTRSPEVRASELSNTSIPGKFQVVFAAYVDNCDLIESQVHQDLSEHRVDNKREFFKVSAKVAKAVIYQYLSDDSYVDRDSKESGPSKTEISRIADSIKNWDCKVQEILTGHSEYLYNKYNNNDKINIIKIGTDSKNRIRFKLDDNDVCDVVIGIYIYDFRFDGSSVSPRLFDEANKLGMEAGSKIGEVVNAIDELDSVSNPLIESLNDQENGEESFENNYLVAINAIKAELYLADIERSLKKGLSALNAVMDNFKRILEEAAMA